MTAERVVTLQWGILYLIMRHKLLDRDNIREGFKKQLGIISLDLEWVISPEPKLSPEQVLSQQVRLDS